jgi:TRAP-type C4-dicarboxylate transport system substrate-binding protein
LPPPRYEPASIPSFKALSPADQKILLDTAARYHIRWNEEIVALEKKSRVDMEKKGKKMYQASDADRAKAANTMKPYWPEWAKSAGPDAVEALQKVREALGK